MGICGASPVFGGILGSMEGVVNAFRSEVRTVNGSLLGSAKPLT